MGMRSWACAGLAVLALAACSDGARDVPDQAGSVDTADPADSDPIVLAWPRSCWSQPNQAACAEIEEGETFMASEVGGELVVEGGCAMTDDGSGAAAVLLPYGTAWDPTVPGLRFADGSTVAVGAEVWIMGGWFERLDRSRADLTYNGARMVSGDLLERVWTCIDASERPGAIQIGSP